MSTVLPQNRASFSRDELVLATGGDILQEGAAGVLGISTDSRADLSGRAFVALVGQRFDGHGFLEAAAAAGAAALVVEKGRVARLPPGVLVVAVDDTLSALGQLAHFHRQRWQGQVVAIAGSAGKTTTRTACSRVLELLFPGEVHATRGNLNNRIGVPLTLFGLGPEHRLLVVELGTNQPGEVQTLARLVKPDVGVLTLIDLEHTEGLGDLEGVFIEESALFRELDADGVAIGNWDDPRMRAALELTLGQKRGYGSAPEADVSIRERRLLSPGAVHLELRVLGRTVSFTSTWLGEPGALAAAAASLVAETLAPGSVTAQLLEQAFSESGEAGRHRVVALPEGRVLVDDSYNSNPGSVRAAIRSGFELAESSGGRLWLVLGDMLELGALSRAAHREMGRQAAASGASGSFFVGPESKAAFEVARQEGAIADHFVDAGHVGSAVLERFGPRDVVLVKASRGLRVERVVADLGAAFGASETTAREPVTRA